MPHLGPGYASGASAHLDQTPWRAVLEVFMLLWRVHLLDRALAAGCVLHYGLCSCVQCKEQMCARTDAGAGPRCTTFSLETACNALEI